MVRPSPSVLFVCGAVVLAAAVGFAARSASGSEESALPSDAARLGFVVVGPSVQGVAMLDATRPFNIDLLHGPVHGVPADATRLARTRAVVTRELTRYPRKF